jgi:hypothetical protein
MMTTLSSSDNFNYVWDIPYLKLTYSYCVEHELIDRRISDMNEMDLPFRIDLLPVAFPNPKELVWSIES